MLMNIFFLYCVVNSVLKGAPWREAWLRRYEKLHNVAVKRGAWQGVIWRAMARVFSFETRFFALFYTFSNRTYKYCVFY